ncbi:hypothetical protein RM553_08240 [Zunongwangia sp. F363]|uniref:Lipoprotein n=1 Tax=Autumnicola tepida TaxID=3075595 RepID=A0ABU3C910_9FLAO|nr:hypothetical protein [Zunongwangia sp. F363]MDT0642817.1 hypothetical protein [Zunongwangia sp. F363]
MKLQLFFRFLIMLLIIGGESCSKDDDEVADGYLAATANTLAYISSKSSQGLIIDRYISDYGTVSFQLTSSSDDNKNIELFIPNFSGAGIYDIKTLKGSRMEFSTAGETWFFDRENFYSNEFDYIEITSISKNSIEGNFKCRSMIHENTFENLVLQGEFKGRLRH